MNVNSKQLRKDKRYKVKLIKEFTSYVREMLIDIKEGKTTIDKELFNCKEIEEILSKL